MFSESVDLLVNRTHPLDASYVPSDLIPVNIPFAYIGNDDRNYLRTPAAQALEKMFADAKNSNLSLIGVSGYRSYDRQKMIYEQNLAVKGEEHTNLYSAKPGQSEHQTGLAIDLSTPSIFSAFTTDFENTPEGIWLNDNSHRYGFILRYPSGKEHITGYAYEPWHFRYVGIPLATYLKNNNLTLEEYDARLTRPIKNASETLHYVP